MLDFNNFVVRIRGLEPPLPCENVDLNHARLPIPPYPREMTLIIITWTSVVPKSDASPALRSARRRFCRSPRSGRWGRALATRAHWLRGREGVSRRSY